MRAHRCAFLDLLRSFDNDAIAGLEPLFDDPFRAQLLPDFDRLDMRFVLSVHCCHLIAALKFGDRPLRNQQSAFLDLCAGAHPRKLSRAKERVWVGKKPSQLESPGGGADFTPGEKEFLDQLANGYAYKEIADRMKISIDTVRSYVRTVYEKLHVHSRTEAVVKYLRG